MKKIKTFGISALRNEESFGFLKVVVTETDNLPAEETTPAALTNAVVALKEAYKQFDYALESSAANPDVATASAEEGDHWTIAAEYIAYRDNREGIRGYDITTMNDTLLTVRDIGTAEPGALHDASADVLGCSEREENDSLAAYLEDLGMRLRRLG